MLDIGSEPFSPFWFQYQVQTLRFSYSVSGTGVSLYCFLYMTLFSPMYKIKLKFDGCTVGNLSPIDSGGTLEIFSATTYPCLLTCVGLLDRRILPFWWIIDMPRAKGYGDTVVYFNSWVGNFTKDSSRYRQVVKWIHEYCIEIDVTFEWVHPWLIRKWLYLLRKDLPMWTLISAFWSALISF